MSGLDDLLVGQSRLCGGPAAIELAAPPTTILVQVKPEPAKNWLPARCAIYLGEKADISELFSHSV